MNNFLSEEDENLELNDPMATPADALHDARTTAEEARDEAVYGEEEPLNDLDNPDVDIFSAAGMEAPATAFAVGGRREIGFGEKIRKGMEAETGEEYTTGEAVASRLIPFAAKTQAMGSDYNTRALESVYEGTLFSDLDSVSPAFVRKYGWDGEHDIDALKRRRLDAVTRGFDYGTRAYMESDEFKAMSPDEQLKALRPFAEKELYNKAKLKKDAESTLSETTQGAWSKVGTGLIENIGYTGEFAVGSIIGGGALGGFVLSGGTSAISRAMELSTNDYDIDEAGNLVNKNNAHAEEDAFIRGFAGGFLEAGVETALGGALGLVGKGIAKIPGASRYLVQPTKWAAEKTKGALYKIPGARTLAGLGRTYRSLSGITGQHEIPMELLEENVQAFVDDVVGLGAKKGEWEGFSREWDNYKRDTLNWNTQRDILLGMVGTMVLQGSLGAGIDKARRAPMEKRVSDLSAFDYTPDEARGRLSLLVGDKVDELTNSQAVFLAKFSHLVRNIDNPRILENLLSRHDERVRAMGEKIIGQRTWEYDQILAKNGENVQFTPDVDGNGATNFYPGEYTDEDGQKREARIILDSTHGVGIRENSGEEGDAFTVSDNRGNEIGVNSYESALICANMLAKQNAVRNLENGSKAEYINQIIAQNYGAEGANKFKFVNSLNDFVDMLKAEGASEEAIAKAKTEVGAGGVRLEDGRVVLMLDNINSPMDAREILQHEVIGHDTLANKFGGREGVIKFLRSLDSKTMRDQVDMTVSAVKRRLLALRKASGVELTPEVVRQAEEDAARYAATDEGIMEIFARLVERRRHNPAIWQKLSHFMRERGRSKGATTPINDADLEVILSQMEQESRGSGSMEGEIRVSPTLSVGGMTFLRTKSVTPDVDVDADEGGGATVSEADYNAIRLGIAEGMKRRDGVSPSDSAVNDFIVRVLGADSWDEASDLLSTLGENLTEDVYNLVKGAYNASAKTEGGVDETGRGADEAQPQSEQESGRAPTEGKTAGSGSQAKTDAKARNRVKEEIAGLYETDINRTVDAAKISDVVADNWAALDAMEVGSTFKTSDGREFVKTAAKGKNDAVWESAGRKNIPIKQLALAETSGNIAKAREKEAEAKRKREENKKRREETLRKARLQRKAVYQRFIDEELLNPNSLFAIWNDRGYLFALPETDSRGRFISDPAAEALNHFFDGMTGTQREMWKNRIFGYERTKAATVGNDVVVEIIIRHTGNEDFRNNYEAVLDAFVAEYERFQDWKASGAVGRQEREAMERLEAEEAAEREFYLDEIADKELADKEYNNAFAEVERYDEGHPFIEMFSFENLSKLKKGDTIRFDHSDIEWVFESFDPKSGVMIVSEPQWAAEERAWADGEEDATPRNVRYRVTKDGISEITEKEEKKDDTEDEGGTPETGSGDAKSEPGEDGKEDKVTPPPKKEQKPKKESAPKKEQKPKKESAPKSDAKKKPPKKSSLDLGDASSALDDALDGLDDVFGSFSLATFSAPSIATFSAPNTAGFDPEKFGKQVIAVGKVVNVLASKGFNTFKDLATVIFEKKPELWPNVKPHLRKVWNAIAEENDYEEVSKKEAEAVFSALESGDNTPDTPTEPPTEPPTPPTEPPTDNEPPTPPAPPTPPTEPPAPPSDKPPAPPEPTSGKKRKFTKEEAGKIAFDLGGSEADQKEVADLLGDILFANPEFAVAEIKTQLPTGETPAAPVAVAPRELTEEERQHNETAILKLIKKLAEMGHKTFDKLVRAIANASYKLYHAVKNTLYTHWQKALDRGVDVDDSISRKQANEVIKEIDDELNDALEIVPPRADGRTEWSLDDQRNAYLALTNRGFAQKNPNALAIANEMLEQGVLVSAIVQNWWKTDDAAYWPVQGLKVEKASDAAALFQMLSNPYVEIFKALYLDKNRRVLEGRVVAIGSRGAVSVSLSSITDKVPKGTVGVILSHNHPTGNVIPSGPVNGQRGDVKATEEWQTEFRNRGLILLDHIVTDTDKFTSFAAGVSKGQTKLYGNFHFDAQADEHWNPKIVNRGTGLYEYPPIPWELVPREQFGLGFYNGRHSQSIATYFAQQLSTHNQDHSWIVFLNDDQKVTGIIRIPVAESIKSKEPLSKLVDEIIKYHEEAASVMVYFGRERFKSSEVGLACESNNLNIAAIYSISQGKFIGGRSSTPEDELFLMDGGYQEMLRSGSISEGHIWPDGGKQASRRAPKALPLEVPEKKQYTLKQKGTVEDEYISESGLDGDDASSQSGNDEMGGGAEGRQKATGLPSANRLRNRGRSVGSRPGVPLADGGGAGAGVRGGVQELPVRASPVVGGGSHGRSGGVDGEGTSEDSGLHRDGNEGQNVRGDGGESVRRAGNPLQLQPGHALTQNVGDNFIATQKVVDAWEETDLVKRAERNIEALDVLDSLGWPSAESQESDDVVQAVRIGTPEREVSLEEKEILASYTGWAGFQEILYNGDIEAAFRRYEQLNKEYDEAGIPRDDELTIPAAVQKMMAARHIEGADIEERLIEGLKTYLKLTEIIPESIRQTFRYWHPDEESVNRRNGSGDQNAPAMPLNIAEAILDAAADSGLAGGYFLQPTGGWGREVMLTGGRFASDTNWTIFEPNTIKAKILKALFPKANLFSEHQRKADIAQGFFDFGVMVAPNDQSNTDSWTYSHGKHIQGLTRAENDIVRLVERIRPGGLAIFVHSEPTKSQAQRLAREIGIVKGRVLGVIKAPATMLGYKEPSGNSADIWIVQRETTKIVNADVFSGPSENAGIPLETTIGFDVDTDEDGRITMTPRYPDLTIRDKRKFGDELYDAIMNSAMSNADRGSLADPTSAKFKNRLAQAAEIVKRERPNGETFIDDKGVLRIIESGKSKRIRIGSKDKNSKISDFEYSTSQLSGAKEKEVLAIQKSYEKLREALNAVIEADRTRSEDANDKRAALNSAYSEFVDKHGQLGLQAEKLGLAAKVIFLDRYNSSQLAGHIGFDKEKGVDVLGDIFRKNPFAEMPEDTIPSNAQEALLRSMRNKGYIDAVYVGDALGITPRAAVEKMLEERIAFIDPATQKLVDRSEYLSGFVRHKYEQAKKASAFDGRFIANMEELQRVMKPVTTFDVSDERDKPQVSVGCGFIPDDIMHKFFASINISGLNKIRYSRTVGKWILNVNWKKVTLGNPMILGLGSNAGSQKATRIKAWLNQNPVIVKNENGMPDIEATQEVERLFNDLNDQLANFIESNPSRKAAVERAYWEHLGDDAVERDYQGYELKVPGMSSKWIANISGADRWYQRRAINGVFYGDIQMLDHNVGAGKTAEMIIATMMLKHYGRIRKPMLAVKLATIDQIRQSVVDIFPGAKVLTLDAEDFQPGNRLTTLDLIREFDGDMIIIPHSAFGRIGFSEGLIDEIMAQESLDYDNDIATVREMYPELNEKGEIRSKEGRGLLAEIEKAKARALRQYEKLYNDAQANRSVAYDQLGIDYLIVDEAHNFKSVEHYTSKTPEGAKFRGINIKSESSNVSKSMIAACHYSNKLHGGKNGVLFATGTPLSNSFVEAYTMMNYLVPSRMREMGMPRLDSFLNTYCGWKLDFTPREGGFDMEIGLTIRNAFPLSKLLRQVWDVALAGHEFQLKGMPGLKPSIVQVPQSTTQSYAIEAFGELANRIAEGEKIPGINKGYLQQYGRWIAINPYLVGIADTNNARARVQAKIIKALNNKDPKMAHLVFCDIGAPKEFRFKNLTDIGGDTFEVVTANGRVATIGPRNLNSGQRKITIRQEYKKDASLTEYREVSWSYLDKIPGEGTGGAPFNPTALYKALIRLERGALARFGKSSEISARKTGAAYSKGTLKEKGKVRGGKALDFSALIEKQIAELGYDPRLDVIQSKEDMMIPPISKREMQQFLITGDFNGLMDYISSKPMYHLYQGHVFDEYSRMKLELLREGFKEDEIVVVNNKSDFTSEIEKDLNDKDGKIKVILASKTIQEGVNIQRRLMSVHHHDIPWMPGDKTQRDGRGWRFGNDNEDVYVFNYVTPDSADGKSYSIVAGKARIFSQVQTVPEHNRLDSAVDESGSLQEMISFAVKDKRVYWRDRLTKQLESNTRIVDGETRRIGELETSIASLKRGRDNQVRIVEEAKEEILPIFKAREEAKREFAIDTPDGRKLTGLAEVIEYIQDEAVKIPLPPVPKSMAEVQAEGSANEREIGKVFGVPVIVSLEWGIASPGMEDTDPLGLYTPRYSLAIPGGIRGRIPLEKVKNPETGKFTPRITDFQVTNGIKGGLTRLLNPVSENRLVPKSLAKMEDDLLDYNERIHNAENMLKNARASLEKAQEPIYSIRSRLKMIEDSIKADIDHDPQPIAGFIENINDYMSEPGEDEESSLWKIDGGAILDEGAFDMKKHVTPPKVKSSETDPNKPDPDTPPPTGTDGGGGSMSFADTSYAVGEMRTSASNAAFLARQGEDAAYMDAVNRGDMETAQRMVREAFLRAFPNTKVLDKDGLPLVVYHGTASDEQIYAFDFSQNNPNRMEHTPVGTVWFTSNREIAGGYNGGGESNIYPVFLNIENPASADAKGYAFKDEEFGFGDIKSGKGFSTGNFVRRAQNSSRDGVIIRNIIDSADSADIVADDYIVFNPTQIKSAAPVTYDDNGNVIPLSQRFNAANEDIRYADPSYAVNETTGITNDEQDEALTSRGIKAPKKRVRGDEKVLRGAEEIESNPDFVKTLANVVRKNPRPIKAEENIALARDWLKVKDEYDAVVEYLKDAVGADDKEGVRRLTAQKNELEKRMVALVEAREAGVGEAARTLRTNRFLFTKDYSFAGLVAQRIADLGRPLTEVEYKELRDIADRLKKLDEADRMMLLARISAMSNKMIKDFIESQREPSGKTHTVDDMRRMLRKRNEALAQIEVVAFELGGEINALIPGLDEDDFESIKFLNMRKYLRNLAEYHVYINPNITELELIEALIEDISPWFTADAHVVRQIFSGYGHSWQIDRNDIQRKVSDLSSQARVLEHILALENGELPRLTGPQRSDPSDTTRELIRIRDQLRRQVEREGGSGSDKRLKTLLASAKTRYEHMIKDIKAALEAGAQLPKREPLDITDPELESLKEEYKRLREEYDAIWGKGSKMSDEQKRQMVEKALKRALDRWVDKLSRARSGDFAPDPKKPKVTSDAIEALREKVKAVSREWSELKAARRVEDWTEEEIRAYAKRRLDALAKAVQHWQTASITGDIAPKKKLDVIPFLDETTRKQYDDLQAQRNAAFRHILDMREHDRNKKAPLGVGYAKEYASFVNNMMRSLLATADFSAMMRQTAAITTAHPLMAFKTLFKTIGPMLSSSSAIAADKELRANPLIREALDNKWLEWRALEGTGGSDEVEMFHGVDAQAITIGKRKDGTERRVALGDIPLVKSVLHASERQYASFINMVSAELYTKMVNSPVWGKSGPTDYQKRELASYINMANGSAQLGAKGKQAMSMLTKVFWAPKLAVSRAQLAIGAGIIHPFVSGEKTDATMKQRAGVAGYLALEQARAFLGAVAAGWLMLALFGDDDDKYAQEQAEGMGKLLRTIRPRIGSSSLDFSGGVAQWWNLMRMAYTGVKETATGRQINLSETYGRSKTQELWRFFQGKLNPLWSNALAMWEGKDYVGNEFGIWNLAQNVFVPLAGRDIWEAAANENNGLGRGILMAPFILTGAGGSTYDIDRYSAAKNLVDARTDALEDARKGNDRARVEELMESYPELARNKQLSALFDKVKKTESLIKRRERKGLAVPQMLHDRLEKQKADALEAFRRWR